MSLISYENLKSELSPLPGVPEVFSHAEEGNTSLRFGSKRLLARAAKL